MEEDKKRITVEIFDQHYKIMGNASVHHMRAVASFVDEKMREIADANPRLDTAKAAVLAAVNITDEYYKLKEEHEILQQQLKSQQDREE